MGAGEAILGASTGSGVAAGASTALGNSTVGHFISGVAGGVAGRAAGRAVANRLRNRNIENQELQPLLSSRTGEEQQEERYKYMERSVQGQINEPPIQDMTHKIMNPLHESATLS